MNKKRHNGKRNTNDSAFMNPENTGRELPEDLLTENSEEVSGEETENGLEFMDVEEAGDSGNSGDGDFYEGEEEGHGTEAWGDGEYVTDGDFAPGGGFRQRLSRINWHIVFGFIVLLSIALIIIRFKTFGNLINPDEIQGDSSEDVQDYILPLIVKDGHEPIEDGVTTIVAFGNAPFADDRESPDNLANMIAEKADATVYNCSVSGTYLAAQEETFRTTAPMDAFNFYWLTTLICLDNKSIYEQAFEAMGDDTPEDAREVYDTLTSLDFSKVDVITLMYDGSDYLDGRGMSNDQNETDIQTFTGNMRAGIQLLQETFPHIRIIVMSPTYAFAINEEGEYISSDMFRYGQDVLSTYAILQFGGAYTEGVTFVDHIYGTVTEDNAVEFLTDNIHLNVEGRKKVAERFIYALNYYEKYK